MSSLELIKTSLVQYEFNKRFRLYRNFVKHNGLVYIPENDFPDDYSKIGDYKKLILLSEDDGDTIVKKHQFPRLHGKKMIMAFINGDQAENFIAATYTLKKNQQDSSKGKTIDINISTNDMNSADEYFQKLYERQIEWQQI